MTAFFVEELIEMYTIVDSITKNEQLEQLPRLGSRFLDQMARLRKIQDSICIQVASTSYRCMINVGWLVGMY
jgi:hypothetical protein